MSWFSDEFYEPIQAGSIDGTTIHGPHDRAIRRAVSAHYNPDKDPKIEGDPYKTLFVGRLNWDTTEDTLREFFSQYGKITHIRLVRDIVTGVSKGYAFITFSDARDFREAFKNANHQIIDNRQILVDFERERIVKGWIPRRLGGGLGGRKESGQLRFGGRDRPFKRPLLGGIPATFDFRRDIDRFEGRKYYKKGSEPLKDSVDSKDHSDRHRDSKHDKREGSHRDTYVRDKDRDPRDRADRHRDRDRESKDRHRDRESDRSRDRRDHEHRKREHYRDKDKDRERKRSRERDDRHKRSRESSTDRSTSHKRHKDKHSTHKDMTHNDKDSTHKDTDSTQNDNNSTHNDIECT